MPSKTNNIIVLCSDQHHHAMSGYRGHPTIKTPHLDALAADGTCFTNAYCNSPVCTPSRMSFITGKYAHEIGSWFLEIPLDPAEMTWPRRLEKAGIPSTMLGKMDFCGAYQSGGFSDYKIIKRRGAWSIYPRNTPFSARLNGYIRKDKWAHILNAGIRENAVTDGTNGNNDRLGYYDHDRHVTDWAVEYIRDKGRRKGKEPWALYVGLLYPHWPFCVPERFFNMYYPDVELPLDARFPNPGLHPALQHFQECMHFGNMTDKRLRTVIAAYYGMITCMDEMIGRILDELRVQGFYDDSYILYTSDHGEALGEHGLFYKQTAYENSVKVPLILKGPGVMTGQARNELVSLVDMYPTIMDIAGLQSEPNRPGSSWLPLARGEQAECLRYVFAEHHGNFIKQDWYMLRVGDYKYIYYQNLRPSFFNLKNDPHELNDLATNPTEQTRQLLVKFETRLRSIINPDVVSLRAKTDLGLIGPNGEDYTQTLTCEELEKGRAERRFPLELPNVPDFSDPGCEF